MKLEIRAPKRSELPGCRMLLQKASVHPARRLLVALADSPPYIVGASSWLQTETAIESLYIATVHTHRRQGIGSSLLESAMMRAPVSCVSGWVDVLNDQSGQRFALARGFTRTNRLTRTETDAQTVEDHLLKLRARLQKRIPQNVRILPLREVSRDQVATLCAEYISSNPGVRSDLIAHQYSRGDFDNSPVVVVGSELAGFLLYHLEGNRIIVSARVVLPKFRRSWVNVLLLTAFADRQVSAQGKTVSFDWHEDNDDTAKLSERFPGALVRVTERYAKYGA